MENLCSTWIKACFLTGSPEPGWVTIQLTKSTVGPSYLWVPVHGFSQPWIRYGVFCPWWVESVTVEPVDLEGLMLGHEHPRSGPGDDES